MLRSSVLLAGISGLALIAVPLSASAQGTTPVHAVVDGTYVAASEGGLDFDGFVGGGEVVFNGANGFGAEGVAAFGTGDLSGIDVDAWTIGGGVFYRTMQYAVGAGVQHFSGEAGGFEADTTNYGVAGDAYLSDFITIGANGGGFSGDGADGWYIGGHGTVYPIPNLALGGGITYADADGGGDATNYSLGAEFLPFQMVPVSVRGGYDRLEQGGFDIDVWSIGLTAYIGAPGDGTLRGNHRSGGVVLSRAVNFNF